MTFSQMLSSDSIITYDEPTTKKQITITKPIIEKPKRKQVKNACGKITIHILERHPLIHSY